MNGDKGKEILGGIFVLVVIGLLVTVLVKTPEPAPQVIIQTAPSTIEVEVEATLEVAGPNKWCMSLRREVDGTVEGLFDPATQYVKTVALRDAFENRLKSYGLTFYVESDIWTNRYAMGVSAEACSNDMTFYPADQDLFMYDSFSIGADDAWFYSFFSDLDGSYALQLHDTAEQMAYEQAVNMVGSTGVIGSLADMWERGPYDDCEEIGVPCTLSFDYNATYNVYYSVIVP